MLTDTSLILILFESLLLLVTVLLTLALAVIGWLRWERPGARYFGFMLLAASFWALCELGELLAPDAGAALRWSQFSYLGIVSVPLFWFFFAMDYSGRLQSLPRAAFIPVHYPAPDAAAGFY